MQINTHYYNRFMLIRRVFITLFAGIIMSGVLSGCAVPSQQCLPVSINSVSPTSATADHMDPSPGDQQKYVVSSREGQSALSCPISAIDEILTPTWTVSDTVNVKISSAKDSTNGVATCIGATTAPVVLTATGVGIEGGTSQVLATATLTCK